MTDRTVNYLLYFVLGLVNTCIVIAKVKNGSLTTWNALNVFAALYCAAEMALL